VRTDQKEIPLEFLTADQDIKIALWDTSGQERFFAITPSLLRGASGMVLVYDRTNLESFKSLDKFMEMFTNTCAQGRLGSLPVLLLGNKSDCVEGIEVPERDLVGWMASNQIKLHYNVSAKTGDNVREALEAFLRELIPLRELMRLPRLPAVEESSGCC
jgi:GTPase SAR1 family protein